MRDIKVERKILQRVALITLTVNINSLAFAGKKKTIIILYLIRKYKFLTEKERKNKD